MLVVNLNPNQKKTYGSYFSVSSVQAFFIFLDKGNLSIVTNEKEM